MHAPTAIAPPVRRAPNETYGLWLAWFAKAGALLVVSVGTTVAFGWICNIGILKSLLPGLVTMKINTACGFIVAGISLWLLQSWAANYGRLVWAGRLPCSSRP